MFQNKKYRCWVSDKEKILSFRPKAGYEMKEFNSYAKFQEYCYKQTYWGYRVE